MQSYWTALCNYTGSIMQSYWTALCNTKEGYAHLISCFFRALDSAWPNSRDGDVRETSIWLEEEKVSCLRVTLKFKTATLTCKAWPAWRCTHELFWCITLIPTPVLEVWKLGTSKYIDISQDFLDFIRVQITTQISLRWIMWSQCRNTWDMWTQILINSRQERTQPQGISPNFTEF